MFNKTQYLDAIKCKFPFSQQSEGDLQQLLGNAEVILVPRGKVLFQRAEADAKLHWLLEGAVDLLDEQFAARPLRAEEATEPVDRHSPHQLTAITTEPSTLLVCDRAGLLPLMEVDPIIKQQQEVPDDLDWMAAHLDSPLFDFIPPANIQRLFRKFEAVRCKQDEVVVSQGETGDYFYVIQSGDAKVERKTDGKATLLTALKPGDSFGQDALVSDAPRNATVTMTSDGTLMRLAAADFEALLLKPVMEIVTLDEVSGMLQKGEACIIDVGSGTDTKTLGTKTLDTKALDTKKGDECRRQVPLLMLRENLCTLQADVIYVTTGDNEKQAALGAYTLNEHGFTAWVLKS